LWKTLDIIGVARNIDNFVCPVRHDLCLRFDWEEVERRFFAEALLRPFITVSKTRSLLVIVDNERAVPTKRMCNDVMVDLIYKARYRTDVQKTGLTDMRLGERI
jgi:hypothetical protein